MMIEYHDMFQKILQAYYMVYDYVDGKKTYILGTLGILTAIAWMFRLVPDDVAIPLLNLLGFGGLVTLRQSVAKMDTTPKE